MAGCGVRYAVASVVCRRWLSENARREAAYLKSSKFIPDPTTESLLRGVLDGKRAKLAEAITLVESSHPEKRKEAQWLLTQLLRNMKNDHKYTLRIGLSGSPGAGKSTLIECLGKLITARSQKVAVLAVDPSSSHTGGSILGDKTRMPKLANDPLAYIRPSPSRGTLGGVTRSTQEAIILCEGAGYDVVLVETVGVGQSETAVADMVDMFVLLVPPAAGDELQGLKKGIVEHADLVVVTKADGDLLPEARRVQSDYLSALKLMKRARGDRHWKPTVTKVSSLRNEGIQELWEKVEEFAQKTRESGVFERKRSLQRKSWLWTYAQWQLMQRFEFHGVVRRRLPEMEQKVTLGLLAPGTAADKLLDLFFDRKQTL